jgi:hypothetical protein
MMGNENLPTSESKDDDVENNPIFWQKLYHSKLLSIALYIKITLKQTMQVTALTDQLTSTDD